MAIYNTLTTRYAVYVCEYAQKRLTTRDSL